MNRRLNGASMAPSVRNDIDEGSVVLMDFLRRNSLTIFLFGVLGAVGSAYACQFLPKRYESETQILVTKKDSNLANEAKEKGNWYDGRMAEEILSTHIQIVGSRRIAQDAIELASLDSLPVLQSELSEDVSIVDYLVDHLEITRGGEGPAKRAHVLNIAFQHSDSSECSVILSAIVQSYQSFLSETFEDLNGEAVKLIGKSSHDLRQQLAEEENAYRVFREKAPLLWQGDESQNVHQARVKTFELALGEVRLKLAKARSRLAVMEELLAGDEPENKKSLDLLSAIDEMDVERLSLVVEVETGDAMSERFQATQPERTESANTEYQRLLALKLSERDLLTELGPGHPKVAKVRDQVSQVEGFLQKMRSGRKEEFEESAINPRELAEAYRDLLKNDIAALIQQEESLDAMTEEATSAAKQLVDYEVENSNRMRELTRIQGLYDTLVARMRDADLVNDYSGFIIEVLSPVKEGEDKSVGPIILSGLGGVASLVFGFGIAILSEMFDKTFHSSAEIYQALGIPVLIHIPRFKSMGLIVGRKSEGLRDSRLFTFHNPQSSASEAIRALKTSLNRSTQRSHGAVITCVAARAGDGTSTIVANLGITMAQSGMNVLLVDGNSLRPEMSRIMNVADQPGLTDVAAGRADLPDVIQKTVVDGLNILPFGQRLSTAKNAKHFGSFPEIIEKVSDGFDIVLVDAAPLLSSSLSEEFAVLSRGVVIVLQIHSNGRPEVVRVRERLALLDVDVLSAVVNRFINKRQGYVNREVGFCSLNDGARLRTNGKSSSARTLIPKSQRALMT